MPVIRVTCETCRRGGQHVVVEFDPLPDSVSACPFGHAWDGFSKFAEATKAAKETAHTRSFSIEVSNAPA